MSAPSVEKPMKIFTITMAPVNPPYDDGIKNMAIGVARRVKKHSFFFVSSFFGRAFGNEENIAFFRSPFQRQARHGASFIQKAYVVFLIFTNMRRMDVFQFSFTPHGVASRLFARAFRKAGRKCVQAVSSIHTLCRRNGGRVSPELFFADRVAVYSDHARSVLEEAGVRNVVRIYPGIDTARFENFVDPVASFPPGTFSENGANVVYAGSYKLLDESFSLEGMCDIVERTATRKDVKFIMACRLRTGRDKALKKKFRRIAEERGIGRHLAFLDKVEDMPSLFRKCDLGIMPARTAMSGVLEIPMVILEMAAMAKPVIYGKVRPLEELHEKGLGIMINGGSTDAYSEKILSLLDGKGFSSEIGERSRAAVRRHFDIEGMAREYEKLYEAVNC